MEKYTYKDFVKKPPQYRFGGYELIEVLKAKLRESKMDTVQSALWTQIVQYLFRYDVKGNALQDLGKAKFYLDDLYEETKKKESERYDFQRVCCCDAEITTTKSQGWQSQSKNRRLICNLLET